MFVSMRCMHRMTCTNLTLIYLNQYIYLYETSSRVWSDTQPSGSRPYLAGTLIQISVILIRYYRLSFLAVLEPSVTAPFTCGGDACTQRCFVSNTCLKQPMYYNPLLRVDSHLESELSFAPRIRTVFQGLCTIYFSQSPLTYARRPSPVVLARLSYCSTIVPFFQIPGFKVF